jgi:hypothetical protein
VEQVKEIRVENLSPSKLNHHPRLPGPEFSKLCASIEEHGLLDPIRVRGSEIIAGENRYEAFKWLAKHAKKMRYRNYSVIPALEIPDDTTDGEALQIINKSNFGRRQYTDKIRQQVLLESYRELIMSPKESYRFQDGTIVKNKAVFLSQVTSLPMDRIKRDLADIRRNARKQVVPKRWRQTLTGEQERLAKQFARIWEKLEKEDEKILEQIKDLKNRKRGRLVERRLNLRRQAAEKLPGGIKQALDMFGKKK